MLIVERCLLLLAWLAAAYGAGHLASSWSHHPWVRTPVTLLIALLPVWDVIPGVFACQLAIRELGGAHLYRIVSADGYLDLRRHSDLEVWSSLPSSPYLYIEIHSDHRPLSSEVDPAYYQLTLALRGGPSCAAFDALPTVIQQSQAEGLGDFCPVVQRRDIPISRYQVEATRAWEPLSKYNWLRPVEAKWARISDRSGNVVLAESYALRYLPWIATVGLDHLIGAYESENATDALVDINVPAVIRPSVLP